MKIPLPRKWWRLTRTCMLLPLLWLFYAYACLQQLDVHSYDRRDYKAVSVRMSPQTQRVEARTDVDVEMAVAHDTNELPLARPEPSEPFDLHVMEKQYYRRQDSVVNPHNFSYLLNPGPCCQKGVCPYLVILVFATARSKDRRWTIRNTWGDASVKNEWPSKKMNKSTKVYFLLAKSKNPTLNERLEIESEEYGDIIQEDFIDSYMNLTLKSLMALKWTSTYCKHAHYVMKVDDDVFVNTPFILDFLMRVPKWDNIFGAANPESKVRRSGKWQVKYAEFPFQHYPKYMSGAGYIISVPLARRLFDLSFYVKPLWLEDVYVTGILPKILGNISYIGHQAFTDAARRPPTLCDVYFGNVFTATRLHQLQLREYWTKFVAMSHSDDVTCKR